MRIGSPRKMRTQKLDYSDPDFAPSYISWKVHPVTHEDGEYHTDHYTILARYTIHSTHRKLMDKRVVLRRFEARLQLRYWNCYITRTPIMRAREVKERDSLLIERTTLRRKVTLYSNKLKKYRAYQSTLLIQTYDESYDKVVDKLDAAVKRLTVVENLIENR